MTDKKLYVTGTKEPNHKMWAVWDEISLVLADSEEEAMQMTGDTMCAKVNMSESGILMQQTEPDWGDDL